jgi:hypothetical protein
MKTALKILGGIILTLVAGVLVFYYGWLNPPPPEDVCTNIERIAKEEVKKEGLGALGDEATKDIKTDCMRRAGTEPIHVGRAVWVKRLKCQRDAGSMAELKACDDIKSL